VGRINRSHTARVCARGNSQTIEAVPSGDGSGAGQGRGEFGQRGAVSLAPGRNDGDPGHPAAARSASARGESAPLGALAGGTLRPHHPPQGLGGIAGRPRRQHAPPNCLPSPRGRAIKQRRLLPDARVGMLWLIWSHTSIRKGSMPSSSCMVGGSRCGTRQPSTLPPTNYMYNFVIGQGDLASQTDRRLLIGITSKLGPSICPS
jgi:hypothetical protein